MNTLLFPFAEYWWFYVAFSAFVLLLLAADLGIFHRKVHAIGFREAVIWTGVWASLAMLFCLGLYWYVASKFGPARLTALEFLTGYIVEWSLSLDNMFRSAYTGERCIECSAKNIGSNFPLHPCR